jgi:hypothetical protein
VARVLIIEPDPDLRLLARDVVSELGHEPVLESDREGADPLDVILLAVSGRSTTLASGFRRRYPGLPIIYLHTREASYESHAVPPAARVLKPYTVGDLQRALDHALGADPASR